MNVRRLSILIISSYVFVSATLPWGFYAHRKINRLAVFSLPPEMIGLYKANIDFLTENAVNPDRRRYAVDGEAPRHYIDLDIYPDSVQKDLATLRWDQAVEKYTEDTLQAYGIVPWHIATMKYRLEQAFLERDVRRILMLSADIGHYIADANVPLHTTENYNGQMTNQVGIHGFWESRLPELYSDDYDLLIGQADYVEKPLERSWQAVLDAHAALDSVLIFERELTQKLPADQKFTVEERNNITIRNYSRPFSKKYHDMLDRQVERQMKASVKMIADFWYTAWVDAGQPDLTGLKAVKFTEKDKQDDESDKRAWLQRILDVRKEADN
ncbi:MAG: hypothetical protein ACI9V1_001750 [Spirosomataceae bacterium]|jgi:hypothetical protein